MAAISSYCNMKKNYQMQPSFAIAMVSWWTDKGMMYWQMKQTKEQLLSSVPLWYMARSNFKGMGGRDKPLSGMSRNV